MGENSSLYISILFVCYIFLTINPVVIFSTNEITKKAENNMTAEEIFQEQRILSLEGKLDSILKKFEQIIKTIDKQGKTLRKNIAEQKIEKAISEISFGDLNKANTVWKETLSNIDDSEIGETLKQIIVSSYAKKRENFYRILQFILKNKLYSGFPMLYGELEKNDHLHGGSEIFVLARSIVKVCGKSTNFYKNLPKLVNNLISGPFILQNVGNQGYLIAHDHQICTRVSFYECNEGYPKQEVYVHKILSEGESGEDELRIDKRAQWEFVLPEDEELPLSSGFLLKNVNSGEFMISKLLGASSFFLRQNTTFSSYYAKERQCQYIPQTDKAKGSEEIKIGLKHKWVKNTDFFYAEHFAKVQMLPLTKRPFVSDKDEYFWNIIPVNEEDVNRGRSHTMQTYSANCAF